MTYKELLGYLNNFSQEELEMTATVYFSATDEYFGLQGIGSCNDGVLDDKHPVLVVLEGE